MAELRALLIGIDGYFPNRLPDGSSFAQLGGCVRDVARVEAFVSQTLGLPPEHVTQLRASHRRDRPEPPEPPEQWPTYENIVGALRQLLEKSQSGEHVYIHYSGHGGRVPTRFPALKGPMGLDECLVPVDIGNPDARYIRDIELAYVLRQMVDKGLVVTVVLDSCHSGGATRGIADAVIRGLGTVDTTGRPTDSLVAPEEALADTWRQLTAGTQRGVVLGSGWLPEPKGYVLLAACRPSEYAYEYAFDGHERSGVLTHWLLDGLSKISPGDSYKSLHDRVVANVHSQFERQTPQLFGEARRVVFGTGATELAYGVTVLRVDPTGKQVVLNTGQAHGVSRGARFEVYPAGTTAFSNRDQRVGIVEVTGAGDTESSAEVIERFGGAPIEPGAQAVSSDPGSLLLRRKVRLLARPQSTAVAEHERALEAVRMAIAEGDYGWVELAAPNAGADYVVTVTEDGAYEICDPANSPIPNISPPINVADPDSADRLVRRLVHLARYVAVWQLENLDRHTSRSGGLKLELLRAQGGYAEGDRLYPQPFDEPGNTPVLAVGDWIVLRLSNNSREVLNVVVLDLDPAWGISQVYPGRSDTDFMPVDPGEEVLLPLRADLPEGCAEGSDVLKALGTVGTASFRWLELPHLEAPLSRAGQTRAHAVGGLDQLLAHVVAERPMTRDLKPVAYSTAAWTTAQLEVQIQRP
jgi:hypothetical protein